MPAGDTELIVPVQGGNQWYLAESPEGIIHIYLEEDDELPPETAIFRVFETGQAVDGAYVGTLIGKVARHVYQVNAWAVYPEEVEYDAADGFVRSTDDVSEVRDARRSDDRASASGQSEDVQHYLPE